MFSHLCLVQLYLYSPHGYAERIVHIVANCVPATAVYGETIDAGLSLNIVRWVSKLSALGLFEKKITH
jgi:hypothetical protein